jgi:uncharacterized protein with FMN-binding domain
MPGGLVALGSAAVVAIYGAGFLKTRAAAEQFAEPDMSGRPGGPMAGSAPLARPNSSIAPVPDEARGAEADVTFALPTAPVDPSNRGRASETPAATDGGQPVAAVASAVSTSSATAPVASVAVAAAAQPTSGSASSSPAAAAPAPTGGAAASPAATAADGTESTAAAAPVAQPAVPAAPTLKDGVFTGWGTSRHGDIQARIEIVQGKIVSAEVAQCLTRWSCSWIAPLVPQVAARQSENVDYVSGATQSSVAFYWAVWDALQKAK